MNKKSSILSKLFLLGFIIFSFSSFVVRANDIEAGNLQSLMARAAEAINRGDVESLMPYLDDNFTLITMDNNKYSNKEEFKSGYDFFFKGEAPTLTKFSLSPAIEDDISFLTDTIALVNGTADETYHFGTGVVRDVKTRWTAVAVCTSGEWKVKQLHFSANIFDNPVVNELKAALS